MPLAVGLTQRTYYNEQQVATPANTNDQSTTVDLGFTMLQSILVLWPPGVNALMGIRFTLDGVQIVPANAAATFIFDSQARRPFDVGMLLRHPIVIHTHNGGASAHTLFVTFVLTDVVLPSDTQPATALPVLSV